MQNSLPYLEHTKKQIAIKYGYVMAFTEDGKVVPDL